MTFQISSDRVSQHSHRPQELKLTTIGFDVAQASEVSLRSGVAGGESAGISKCVNKPFTSIDFSSHSSETSQTGTLGGGGGFVAMRAVLSPIINVTNKIRFISHPVYSNVS